jgi:phosphate transport system substrate-binding protein
MLVAALVLFAGCKPSQGGNGGDGEELSGDIQIAGSSTVYPITSRMVEEFENQNPGVRISVDSTGTGGGFKDHFIPGNTQINNASRPIKESETQRLKDAGMTAIELKVGIDAMTVVANPDADWAECMTMAELKRIWGPDNPPQNWNEVDPGWPSEPFELYGPATTSGTFDYFTEVVIGEEDQHRSDYQATERDNIIVRGVEGNQYAMGYFGYAYYKGNEDRLMAIGIDDGDGCVKPSLETAQSGEYPLSRPLFIYVNKDSLNEPHIKAFVEFYIRNAATELVSEVGYVPITEEAMQENLQKIGVE